MDRAFGLDKIERCSDVAAAAAGAAAEAAAGVRPDAALLAAVFLSAALVDPVPATVSATDGGCLAASAGDATPPMIPTAGEEPCPALEPTFEPNAGQAEKQSWVLEPGMRQMASAASPPVSLLDAALVTLAALTRALAKDSPSLRCVVSPLHRGPLMAPEMRSKNSLPGMASLRCCRAARDPAAAWEFPVEGSVVEQP